MNNHLLKAELTAALEKIYSRFNHRIDSKLWGSLAAEAFEMDPMLTGAAVVEFMQAHGYMPSDVASEVYKVIGLREHPADMAAMFGAGAIESLFDDLTREPVLTYSNLPADLTEDQLSEVVDSARELIRYLDRGQIYLAQTSMTILRALCPDNAEINDLYRQFLEIRATAGIPAAIFKDSAEEIRFALDRTQLRNKVEADELEAAAGMLEAAIAENYKNYEAYYFLGNVYLLEGDVVKSDYIANLLLDTGKAPVMAKLLKGRILESKGQLRDALYYYNGALRRKPGDREAVILRDHVLALLEGEAGEDLTPDRLLFLDRKIIEEAGPEAIRPRADIVKLIEDTEELIRKGRISEAYYELAKKCEEEPDSTVLMFKKGYALYLMGREFEARCILSSIGKADRLYGRARFLIADIDRNIADNKKYDDIPPVELAEILFSTGEYFEALEILNNMDVASMDAFAWSVKGRCEIEKGALTNALDSFNKAVEMDYQIEGVREMIAMIYQVQRDYDKAIEVYDQAIQLSDSPEMLCNLKASMLYNLQRNEELLKFRNSAYAILGRTSDADGYAGLILIRDEETKEQGITYITNVIASSTSVAEFYLTAADLFMDEGKYQRAMVCVDRGIDNSHVRDALLQKKAEILHRRGDDSQAAIVTDTLLRERPDAAELHYLNGLIFQSMGDEVNAQKWLESAVSLDHDSHAYIYALAECFNDQHQFDNAQFYYTKAIALDENDRGSYKRRAQIYFRKGMDQKALDDINRAMLLDPNDPDIYMLLGNILSGFEDEAYLDIDGADSAGDIENMPAANVSADGIDTDDSQEISDMEKDAEYYYTKALSLEPEYVNGYICRAKYYAEHGKMDRALADMDSAMKIEPDSVRVFMLYGIICHLAGKTEAAAESFEKVIEKEPDNLAAFSYLAKCYNVLERYAEALRICGDGIRMNEEYTNLYVNRGVTYYYLGHYDDAINDFNKVLLRKNYVNNAALATTYKYKGLCFDQQGRLQDAVSDFNMLLKYEPESPGIQERIDALEEEIANENAGALGKLFRRRKD